MTIYPRPEKGDILQLYYCYGCGTVSTQNKRDDCCPVCQTCGEWQKLNFVGADTLTISDVDISAINGGDAPHTEDDDER